MNFDCPHCKANLELEDQWAGHKLACPSCGQPLIAPKASDPIPPSSPKAKPAAPADLKSYKVEDGSGGPWKFLLFLILAAAGGFAFAMYHFHEGPGQTWARAVHYGQVLIAGAEARLNPPPPPVAPPVPKPAPLPPPPPPPPPPPIVVAPVKPAPPPPKPVPAPPDSLTWLAGHKDYWPKLLVTIKADTTCPIIHDGRTAGSGIVPAGDAVELAGIDLEKRNVTVACVPYGGGTQVVPIDATNLVDLAKIAYQQSLEPAPVPAVAAVAPPTALPVSTKPIFDGSGPSVVITADHPIILFQADATGNSQTQAVLTVQPLNFTPSSYVWTQVQDRINPLNSKGTITFSSNNSATPSTAATFSSYGVYQIQLTATDGKSTVVKSTWVNVWDSTPALNPGGNIGSYPDITPPPTIRNLSPDPGPFQHPRVLFTNKDWGEMSSRDNTGAVASVAIAELRKMVAGSLDNQVTFMGQLAQQLDAYAKGDYQGKPPDITTVDTSMAAGVPCMLATDNKNIYSMLLSACYLSWIDQDPSVEHLAVASEKQERCKFLARVIAALARIEFNNQWDRTTKTFHKDDPNFIAGIDKPGYQIDVSKSPVLLALCYDLIYPWMDDPQRKDVRDFLYALSYARHFSNAFATQGPNIGKPNDGLNQNGDFGNLNDFAILMAMAVEGEESAVSTDVQETFGAPQGHNGPAGNWMQPSDPSDVSAWPGSTVASVDNLQRQLLMINQWFLSPWGFTFSNMAYMGLSTSNYLPATVAMAHRAENPFITSNFYNAAMAAFYTLQPSDGQTTSPLYSTNIYAFDHHDGGRGRPFMYFVWKYMYPDDPMVDYVYRTYLPGMWHGEDLEEPLMVAMFGLDPGVNGKTMPLEEVAAEKKLPLLKFDPQQSLVIARNGWKADDLNIWFDCGWNPHVGHCHAERNSFSLFALGRVWTCAPGYHCTISDLQTSILVQDPTLTGDAATEGYIGASPSSATQRPPKPGNFPPLPGHLLEVSESPDKKWALFAGDATVAYDGANGGAHAEQKVDTGLKISSFMYPGFMDLLNARSDIYKSAFDQDLTVSQMDYNPVQYAIRSVLFVRGQRPYVFVVDDFKKDEAAHNFRWSMNSAMGFAAGQDNRFTDAQGHGVYSSLAIAPEATPTEAVLYHSPIDDGTGAGLARLLVGDLSESDDRAQPKIVLQSRPPDVEGTPYLTYGIDNNHKEGGTVSIPSNRILIERDNVVEPKYKILLFPYRTGEKLPATTWNSTHTQLTIDLQNGRVDTLTFDDSNPDHRTRITMKSQGQESTESP